MPACDHYGDDSSGIIYNCNMFILQATEGHNINYVIQWQRKGQRLKAFYEILFIEKIETN